MPHISGKNINIIKFLLIINKNKHIFAALFRAGCVLRVKNINNFNNFKEKFDYANN